MYMQRRNFLKTVGLSGLGASSLGALGLLGQHGVHAQSSNDYKALVCVYLHGGNDGYNTMVPYEGTSHAQYLTYRPEFNASTRSGLGVPRNALLPLQLPGAGTSSGLGLHPSLVRTHSRWNQGSVAWVQNVGNLVEPVQRSVFQSKKVPIAIGAHDVQQDLSMLALQDSQGEGSETGWGSHVLLRWAALTGTSSLNMATVSFAGQNRWQATPNLPQAVVAANEQIDLTLASELTNLVKQGQSVSRPFTRAYADAMSRTFQQGSVVNAVFANVTSTASAVFSASTLGAGGYITNQLLGVARFIEARSQLQAPGRQVFFVAAGGYDTHEEQYYTHAGLLSELDTGLHAFFSSMEALGISQQVTAFTMSDFGRTLRANASHGTDHAWASHHMVMGGAVRGGLYGRAADVSPTSEDIYPYDRNVVIPSTSINQYAATMATWMGLNSTDLNVVFPDLRNFSQANLGFMNS
jgi:uncharacterized protein (DUF1501 family)